MGWFWADDDTKANLDISKCPVNHQSTAVASCPVVQQPKEVAAVCPVNHGLNNSDNDTFINPLNNMPFSISSEKSPGQKINLPKERTMSSIPRGQSDNEGVWEYPSPQQMLNAMLRKGKGSVPEEAVESMVDVHNWLNEAAWREILEWEKPHSDKTHIEPRLLRFIGKPHELSPRARLYLGLSKLFPDRFNENPPFDRHDWTVLRGSNVQDTNNNETGNGETKKVWEEVRYVIDYYGGPDDEESGAPTFFLDVRPALDSFVNCQDRFSRWYGTVVQPTVEKALGKWE
ncbi:hypothetical protein PACTADRAFT_185779 [Pachysolen tannophilus NRRL Y-2460]|uniref:Holocytochrome c-type synthase n=1 Tax=Pachysolen tannophilus NRRL Y-2460 TaxID=669874 RepID=A0A1E4U1M3_PACTA|nr:hypothetical protein PACTADRAFT_185779 [Pachysolen tannophilus NRRL Y-2460]